MPSTAPPRTKYKRSAAIWSRVRFKNGRTVAMEDLVRGWNADGNVWGRPVGLLVLPDGSILISNDFGGRIYRLRYTG